MRAVGLWLATAVAVAVAVAIVPGVTVVGGSGGLLVLAAVLALVNSFVRPVMRLFALPLTVLTLGLFHFVVNALALEFASYLALGLFGSGVVLGSFGSALVASLVISLVSSVSEAVLGLR